MVAQKGNILVGADMDQLELRLAASRWKSQKYLQAFEDGLDPHSSVTAYAVFGKMFEDAVAFNGLVSKWDVSSVTDMAKMFQFAASFNGDISTWNTGSVVTMQQMFRNAQSFNRDLSLWDVGQVTSMYELF